MKNKLFAAALMTVLVTAISCSNSEKKYEEEERSLIADYVAEHNITVAPDANGLYYIEITPGTGENVEIGDSLGVYYIGWFLDGEEFNNNTEETTPFRFRLDSYGLIEGWTIGLTKMKLGTKAQLLVPSKLAYGSVGYGYYDYYGRYISIIPGYSPLLFEIEVVELIKAKK
ncbi:MAG: FKBP-type peptidyl-prolyl cis-trans isomerase [Bacteroidales bacterium]|nr:FKBP-type peptidyl-prolyl cis-trans isomerase [Bacteroidales bacterium]